MKIKFKDSEVFGLIYRKDAIISALLSMFFDKKITIKDVEIISDKSLKAFINNHSGEYNEYKEELSIFKIQVELDNILDKFDHDHELWLYQKNRSKK